MEKQILECLIEKLYSTYEIAQELSCSQTNVMYWLKKHDLKTKYDGNEKECPKCKLTKNLDEFYSRRGKNGGSVYCKECSKDEGKERFRRFKKKCVDYKGGKCEKCGYDKYIGALQFHHLEPAKKEFSLSKVRSHEFNDKIKIELDKCILVCANCHFEIHGSLV
jgi:predicted transcriptional regulator